MEKPGPRTTLSGRLRVTVRLGRRMIAAKSAPEPPSSLNFARKMVVGPSSLMLARSD